MKERLIKILRKVANNDSSIVVLIYVSAIFDCWFNGNGNLGLEKTTLFISVMTFLKCKKLEGEIKK